MTTICLNPYHFEKYNDKELPNYQPHACEARLCIKRSGMNYICPTCKLPQGSSMSNSIIVVKQEVPDEEVISDVNLEFENSIGQLEEKILSDSQIKEEPLCNVEVQLEEDNSIVIKTEPKPKEILVTGEKRKRSENDVSNLAKKSKFAKPFIIQNVNTGERKEASFPKVVYCCHFCGKCGFKPEEMKYHVNKCQSFKLDPIDEIVNESKSDCNGSENSNTEGLHTLNLKRHEILNLVRN